MFLLDTYPGRLAGLDLQARLLALPAGTVRDRLGDLGRGIVLDRQVELLHLRHAPHVGEGDRLGRGGGIDVTQVIRGGGQLAEIRHVGVLLQP